MRPCQREPVGLCLTAFAARCSGGPRGHTPHGDQCGFRALTPGGRSAASPPPRLWVSRQGAELDCTVGALPAVSSRALMLEEKGREGTAGPRSRARPWPGRPVRVPGFRQEGTEAPREGETCSLSAGPRRARCSGRVSRVTAWPDVVGGEPSYSGEGLAFPGPGPPASVLANVGRRVTVGGNEVRGWLFALLGLVVGSSPSQPHPVHLGGWVILSRVRPAPSLPSYSFLPSAWTVFPARFRSSLTTAFLQKAVILVGSREGLSQAPPPLWPLPSVQTQIPGHTSL